MHNKTFLIFVFIPVLICLLLGGALFPKEPKIWPPSTPIKEAVLKPNEWVAVETHGASRRYSGGVVYLPGEKSWILFMGSVGAWNDHGPFCYDEQTFSLKDRLWKNRFPQGKGWTPEVGPCNAPKIPHHGYRLKDGRIGLWGGRFNGYYQYDIDTDRNVIIAYVKNHTLEYDAAKRMWRDLAPKGNPSQGSRFELWWGSLCYDAHNKEFVLFGGNNGGSEFNDTRTWIYSPSKNEWRRLKTGSPLIQGLYKKAGSLRSEAVKLYGACMNRYFKTELAEETKTDPGSMVDKLSKNLTQFKKKLEGSGSGYEKIQCTQALDRVQKGLDLLKKIKKVPDRESLKAGLALKRILRQAEYFLMSEPPPRAHSPMVYDPVNKKIILFGGDRLDMLYADTWMYDCKTRTWEEKQPEVSPSPRAGHAFVYLQKAGKSALIGGYKLDAQTGYWGALYKQLPVQVWTFDSAKNTWAFIKEWPIPQRRKKIPGAAPSYMRSKGSGFTLAAGKDDVVLFAGSTTYACRLDVSAPDSAGKAQKGVKPGTAEWRTGPYDPNWYLEGPAPEETAFQKAVESVQANTWTILTPNKKVRLPRQNRDWGTAVFDPDRDAIYRWSGGHSAHCGSDIPLFSMRTGRYHQKYDPAFPLEGIGSCGSQPSKGTFLGQPWISAHTYHSYAYDPVSKKMICCGHNSFSYVFDPADSTWTYKKQPKGMNRDNFYTLTLCATPQGPYAWTKFGTLFKYNGKTDTWAQVTTSGEKLAKTRCDNSGMCFDSKRNRLIMTHGNFKGNLMAVDLKTLKAEKLNPEGMAEAAQGKHFNRETCYDASRDLMVVATRGKRGHKGPLPWFIYDCAKNKWVKVQVSGPNCSGQSMGLMYDPKRKIVIAVDTNSVVYALKIDVKK